MAINVVYSLLLFVLFCVSDVSGGYCSTRFGTTTYCSGGCCGSSSNRYCCSSLSGAVIAMIGIGVGMFVLAVVSMIVCCICCHRRSRGRPGQVVGQAGSATVITSTSPCPTGPVQQVLYSPGQSPYPTQPAYPVLSPYNPAQPAYNPAQPAYNPAQPAYNPCLQPSAPPPPYTPS